MNDFLEREGLSKAVATSVVLLFGIGNGVGSIIGGLVGQALWNWRPGAMPMFAGVSAWLGMPTVFWLLNADVDRARPSAVAFFAFFGGVMASIAGVIVRPVLMNVNEPETRGLVLAFQVIFF
jgi:predicted MFS family arabinose efflux permease